MSVQTYEQVPYLSKPYNYATADRLAVVGHLFGLNVADPSGARILEVGCAGGGNLVPRALVHPGATFYGIDPALKHVEQARQIIDTLGIDNVSVDQRRVEDLSEADGEFDYIIAHGVYSWIPESSQRALMAAIRDRLAPHGIAYVSYNLLPGWHMRRMVRDAMLFHIEPFEDPAERIGQAHAMLGFLASSSPGAGGPWKRLLQSEQELLAGCGDEYLFHDHLSPDNTPVYFRDFVAQVRSFDLEYLGEAILSDMMTVSLPDAVEEVIGRVSGDLVRTQQYLDFLFNRAFRRSLLVHADVAPERILHTERMGELAVRSDLRRAGETPIPLDEGVPVTFSAAGGRELTTSAPELKAAWMVLQDAAPSVLSFSDWVVKSAEVLGVEADDELAGTLASNGLYAYAQSLVELLPAPMSLDGCDAERPAAFPFAQVQALAGAPWVTTLAHDGYAVDELDRRVLILADGTRTREQMLQELLDQVRSGELVLDDREGETPAVDEALQAIDLEFAGRLYALGRVGALDPMDENA